MSAWHRFLIVRNTLHDDHEFTSEQDTAAALVAILYALEDINDELKKLNKDK